jgi:hypothetical protein
MENSKPKRVDLGFSGGQVLPLRMRDEEHAELRRALAGERRGWHVVRTEDSEVDVDLSQVVYVRLDTEPHRVGF